MAICIRQSGTRFGIVDKYYAAAQREPTKSAAIAVAGTDTFTANFLDMVKMLVAKQQSVIVLVTHGTAEGFTMPLTGSTAVAANTSVLDDLLTVVDPKPGSDVNFRRGIITKNASISDEELNALVDACRQVRNHLASTLEMHIRGCNIGKDVANLDKIRTLFGCKLVTAPTCSMLYASFAPAPNQNIEEWKTRNPPESRRREFTAGGSKLVLDLDDQGTNASSRGVIQKLGDLPAFASAVYLNSSHGKTTNMPLAAMWEGGTYHLPHESGYAGQLIESK